MARARTRTRRAAVDPNSQSIELIKALVPLIGARQMQLPGNTTNAPQTRTLDQVTAVLHAEQAMRQRRSITAAPMPRDPRDEVPFGPIEPSIPDPLDPGSPQTGRPSPRLSEYPVAWNIPGNGERPLPWSVLRAASKNVDIMRRCIEIRKQRIRGMEWSWDVSPTAIEQAFRAQDQATKGHDDIAADLRDKYSAAIGQLTEFWQYPWRSNGLDFSTWAATTVDEALVLDAVAIYPRLSLGGQLLGLEIIDGTTIKPLLDFRGARPTPPFPAFQQILYGFPRGEFTATAEVDDDGNQLIDNAFLADQLIYHRENYQVNTPYGYGPTEQALIAARLYLRRQGWMLSEYDDGVMPEMMLSSDAGALTLLPEQRRAYEQDLNDDLSGQTAARHRAKLLYSGLKPEYPPSVDERYKPEYDLFLIKLLSSFYGVPATELGFTETKGLGGSGMHQAQQESKSENASKPDMAMVATLVNETARRFQSVPVELVFAFNETQGADRDKDSERMVAQLEAGVITLNEARSDVGKAAFPIPEADTPYVMGQAGPIFIEGSKAAADANTAATLAATQARANVAGDEQAATGAGQDDAPQDSGDDDGGQDQVKAAEADLDAEWVEDERRRERAAFRRFLAKGTRARPFVWKHHTPDEVDLIKAGDADPKVPAGQPAPPPPDHRWPGWMLDAALASLTAAQLSKALIGGLDIPALAAAAVAAWPAGHDPPTVGAVTAWLVARGITAGGLEAMLSPVIRQGQTEAYAMGLRSAQAVLAAPDVRSLYEVTVDWGGWKPGNVDAARRIISDDGRSIEPLFAQTAATIRGIGETRVDELAAVLADGLERGETVDAIARALTAMGDGPWAETVAWTETNRATSTAAVDVYAANGVDRKEWFTALDQRVCPICKGNEDQGPVPIDDPFVSGDQNPPGHPRCRCAVLPVVEMEKSARAAATGNEANAERLHAYWTRGEGLAKWVDTPHPWTALYRHLSKFMPPDEAKRTTTVWFHQVTGTYPGSGHHHKEQ